MGLAVLGWKISNKEAAAKESCYHLLPLKDTGWLLSASMMLVWHNQAKESLPTTSQARLGQGANIFALLSHQLGLKVLLLLALALD